MTDDDRPWYSDSPGTPVPPAAPESGPPAPQQPYPQQPFPPQSPAGYQPYGQPGFGTVAQSNGRATTAMVLGIVGLASFVFCYGALSIVLGPLSFFLGRSAQKEIQATPTAWSNAGMAKAGWILGLIQTILAVIVIIVIVAFVIWAGTLDESDF